MSIYAKKPSRRPLVRIPLVITAVGEKVAVAQNPFIRDFGSTWKSGQRERKKKKISSVNPPTENFPLSLSHSLSLTLFLFLPDAHTSTSISLTHSFCLSVSLSFHLSLTPSLSLSPKLLAFSHSFYTSSLFFSSLSPSLVFLQTYQQRQWWYKQTEMHVFRLSFIGRLFHTFFGFFLFVLLRSFMTMRWISLSVRIRPFVISLLFWVEQAKVDDKEIDEERGLLQRKDKNLTNNHCKKRHKEFVL